MSPWIIYTGLTVTYIIVLVLYFLRRSKTHEKELSQFLATAKDQLEMHKQQASAEAAAKINQALEVVKRVQKVALEFEKNAQEEYNQIVEDAKNERKEILAQAKTEIAELYANADTELEEYKAERMREIERNLVKLVVSITQKVVGVSLKPADHEKIIFEALDEVKKSKLRV